MSLVLGIWLAAAVLVGFMWLVRLIAMVRVMRRRIVLGPGSHSSPLSETPSLSVIVAAKDEENNIEACVKSLLKQDYPDYELIIVDDRSTDRTGQLLQELERGASGKLRVLTVESLKDGWFGKNNAMREGIEASRGDWLCFSDADCDFICDRTLTIAVGEMQHREADFLSITPMLETPTFWEKILQPVCALALIIWFLPERVNNPRRPTAYANGAFMMLRRACYDGIGGHDRVKTEVNEDIHMARFAKQEGFRLRVAENDGLYWTRMYSSFRVAMQGWSRIFYGSLGKPHRLAIALFMVGFFSLLTWPSALASAYGWSHASTDVAWVWQLLTIEWSLAVLLMHVVIWRSYHPMRIPPIWSIFYWFGVCLTMVVLFRALRRSLGSGSTTWRGTTYVGSRRVGDVSTAATGEYESDGTTPQAATAKESTSNA